MVGQLKVNTARGIEVIMDVCETQSSMGNITVKKLKEIINKELRIEADVHIIYQGQALDDSYTLSHYGIKHMSTIQTVLELPGGGH